ncbi:MAG: WD40 repeat domain-containing protein [Fimbriimonadaceae bacterium]|nr:WD40 repeat domain-containing protein [Fimbriimonadaceae bacterium]
MVAQAVQPLALIETHEWHTGPVRLIEFSPDRKVLATGDGDMRLTLSESGRVLRSFDLHGRHSRGTATDRMRDVAFSLDGTRLYAAASRYLWALDASTGDVEWRYQGPNFLTFLINPPSTVAVAQDGSLIASFEDGLMEAFLPSGRKIRKRKDNDAPARMDFLSDRQTLVGCDPFTLTVWTDQGTRKRWNARPDGHTLGSAVSTTMPRAAVRTLETVEVYDLDRFERVSVFPVGTGLPLVALDPVRDEVATASVSGVSVRSLSGELVAAAPTPGVRVTALEYDPSGERILVGGRDGGIRVFAR